MSQLVAVWHSATDLKFKISFISLESQTWSREKGPWRSAILVQPPHITDEKKPLRSKDRHVHGKVTEQFSVRTVSLKSITDHLVL